MKITFIITNLRTFGSVRELVETANVLASLGCNVTIATKDGEQCMWLRNKNRVVTYQKAMAREPQDVVILMQEPYDDAFECFKTIEAKFKTFVKMGFTEESLREALATNANLKDIFDNHEICADGAWQLEYIAKLGYRTGVSIGGINTKMFKPGDFERDIEAGISGDPRPRINNKLLEEMLTENDISFDKYWGTFDQDQLVFFLQRCKIFMDNHERGGWCNPVLEAMACGCAVICSDIPCNAEFAIHNKTAIRVKVPTKANYLKAYKDLVSKPAKLKKIQDAAAKEAQKWDYDFIGCMFYEYLKSKV